MPYGKRFLSGLLALVLLISLAPLPAQASAYDGSPKLVVILILGLLATIVVQSLRGATAKAKRTKAEADISEIKTALDRYALDNGYYPTSDQGLTSLVSAPMRRSVPSFAMPRS